MEGSAIMASSPASLNCRERPVGVFYWLKSHEPDAGQLVLGLEVLYLFVDGQSLKVTIVGAVGGAVTECNERILCLMLLPGRSFTAA